MFGRKKPQPETGGAPVADDAPLLAQATPQRGTGFTPAASQMLPPAPVSPAPPSRPAPSAPAAPHSTVASAAATMSSSATQAQGSPMSSSDSPSTSFRPEIPRRTEIPGLARNQATLPTAPGSGAPKQEAGPDPKTLIVGREISLTGQIAACDRLIIEGKVEVSLSDSRFIEISETGVFKGNADIEEAEIRGRFEGKLTVKGRLLIRGTGKVVGEIRYGQIEIECGGQISGSVETVEGQH